MEVIKARVILMRAGKIAIVESKRSGAFMLPGGKLEKQENEKQALEREILEELGITVQEKDIVGPFYTRELKYLGKDENGKIVNKTTKTNFYIAKTEQDFNFEKMNLTEREKKRGSVPLWMNPGQLEYILTMQRDYSENKYARKYAKEYLSVYNEFKQFQIKSQKRSEER